MYSRITKNVAILIDAIFSQISKTIFIYIEENFIKFNMTLFFYYFQMESFQFSKFRFRSVARSFQYAFGEPFIYNNTQGHN